MKDFHGLQKGTALDFYEIVKGCLAANLSGEPVPFPVADFERIVFFGAVGIAGYLYQLVRLIDLEVCQQVQLFGLLNFLRGKNTPLLFNSSFVIKTNFLSALRIEKAPASEQMLPQLCVTVMRLNQFHT